MPSAQAAEWQVLAMNPPLNPSGGNGSFVEGFRAPAGVRKSYKYDPR